MLLSPLLLVILSVTLSSLLVIRNRIQQQVLNDFAEDLAHSVQGFQSFQSQRLQALQRENTLLADLPNLKALMTTSDERTIADGAIEFWKVGGHDLFALASNDGRIVAAYTPGNPPDSALSENLAKVLPQTNKPYLLSGDRLFECNIRPLYFGSVPMLSDHLWYHHLCIINLSKLKPFEVRSMRTEAVSHRYKRSILLPPSAERSAQHAVLPRAASTLILGADFVTIRGFSSAMRF
jgi:hypothetical protein